MLYETGATIISTVRYSPYIFILSTPKSAAVSAMDMANRFYETGYFKYAEPSFLLLLKLQTADPYFNDQWALENIGQYNGAIDADMDVTDVFNDPRQLRQGEEIVVAVIDEGVDLLHEDLKNNLKPGYDAVKAWYSSPPPNIGANGAYYGNDAHGTACAGIIAAEADNGKGISGVAPKSKIMPIRIGYTNATTGFWQTDPSWVADGINWAHCHGADILSNSWYITPSDMVEEQINAAVQFGRGGLGTPVLFSSGNILNISDPTNVDFPAYLDNVIAVGAMSMCNQRKSFTSCDGERWGSKYGSQIDVVAPGVKIATTDITGPWGYSWWTPAYTPDYLKEFNGTSAACPNAAGVMALILSNKSCLTAKEAREILETTAEKVGTYLYTPNLAVNPHGPWHDEMGYGKVNALAAVNLALTYTPSCPDYSLWSGCERIQNRIASSVIEEKPKPQGQFVNLNLTVYPNPFYENAVIAYSLPEPAKVNITIYNGQGKEIIVPIRAGLQTAGKYSLELATQKLPAGIYFYVIEANGKRETRKMIKTGNR